ncbi:helix-hairpin-helix domain-containing protein [Bacillus massiliglaciei]|uniref:helix-hairpin-helix domain-containing protein n=1 Tax=Bacillus massiliglaciei TaxID=1816693 RepID=UPI000A46509C|nr:helix-hairpin-helix domain-containing protein [Bacillus massiliglaciei]
MDLIQKYKKWLAAAAVIACFAGYFLWQEKEEKPDAQANLFTAAEPEASKEPEEPAEPKNTVMKVDVKGAVKSPGVFIAKPGDRVIDLIDQAGGFTEKSDQKKVNLAQLAEDQMVIYVPAEGEEETETQAPEGSSVTEAGAETGMTGTAGASGDGKINLNTATKEELETLNGVGPSKSSSIIEYRETTGKFQSVEDLKNVSGIGDKTFEKLKEHLTVN